MKANAATMSRRRMLAAAAVTMTPTSGFSQTNRGLAKPEVPAVNGAHTPHLVADPAIAAIERHRQAIQARLTELDDEVSQQMLEAEGDAFVAWLTTTPTTMAGVIATLEHASRRPYDDADYANLAESAQYFRGRGSPCNAGEQFPAMIAAALRKIAS